MAYLVKDIAVLAAIIGAGILLVLLGKGWAGLGGTIILCGAMMVPFFHHGSRIDGYKGTFKHTEILLSRENKDEILAYLNGSSDVLDIHPWKQGGVLVDVFTRISDGLILARYFDYADHMAGIDYPLQEITPTQLDTLLAKEVKIKT